jgi:predicted ribosomally synthesized peptide with SipW-like signal peptide
MRHKILMGTLALALPVGTLAAFSSVATATAPAPVLVSCTGITGTITFGTPLSSAGVPTTSKTGRSSTIDPGATANCAVGGVAHAGNGNYSPITVNNPPNGRNPNYSRRACASIPGPTYCDKFETGTWLEFQDNFAFLARKEVKTVTFVVHCDPDCASSPGATDVIFTGKSGFVFDEEPASPCPSEIAVVTYGSVKMPKINKDKNNAIISLCLGTDTHADSSTGSFETDFNNPPSSPVVSVQIDPATSTATL